MRGQGDDHVHDGCVGRAGYGSAGLAWSQREESMQEHDFGVVLRQGKTTRPVRTAQLFDHPDAAKIPPGVGGGDESATVTVPELVPLCVVSGTQQPTQPMLATVLATVHPDLIAAAASPAAVCDAVAANILAIDASNRFKILAHASAAGVCDRRSGSQRCGDQNPPSAVCPEFEDARPRGVAATTPVGGAYAGNGYVDIMVDDAPAETIPTIIANEVLPASFIDVAEPQWTVTTAADAGSGSRPTTLTTANWDIEPNAEPPSYVRMSPPPCTCPIRPPPPTTHHHAVLDAGDTLDPDATCAAAAAAAVDTVTCKRWPAELERRRRVGSDKVSPCSAGAAVHEEAAANSDTRNSDTRNSAPAAKLPRSINAVTDHQLAFGDLKKLTALMRRAGWWAFLTWA